MCWVAQVMHRGWGSTGDMVEKGGGAKVVWWGDGGAYAPQGFAPITG